MSTDGDLLSLPVSDVMVPVMPPSLEGPAERPRREPRRVLHVINGEHFAGAERVQDLLAARLPEYGYEIEFACVKAGRFPGLRTAQHVPLYDVSMQSRFDFRSLGRLHELTKVRQYAMIHAHTPRSLMMARLLAGQTHLPLVYHVHSPTARDSTRAWINRVNSLTERLSLRGVSRMIAVSESLAQHMTHEGFDERRITVIPNGVPPQAEIAARSAPTTTWILGVMALFRPRKGTEVLLESLGLLRQQGHDVRLRAVGGFESESYEHHLRTCAELHRVTEFVDWVGFQRDINQQLAQMDLFVLPSLFGEGMPMVVLEAMAMGLPVIGTNVEGVPEVIRDGLDGRLANANDARALAAAIASVIDGEYDWEFLRQNAAHRQMLHFSDHSMARRLAATYDEILQSTMVPARMIDVIARR